MPKITTPNFVTLHPVAPKNGRLDVGQAFPTLEITRTETETAITYRRITAVDAPDGTIVFMRDPVCRGGSHHRLVNGELVPVNYIDALNELDPENAGRRRYEARLGLLPRKPRRFTLPLDRADDEWVPGDTYPDEHREGAYVTCTKRSGRQIWIRATTYEEIVALGVSP
ncbi:hypothetical protein FV232_09770 [Methylobacterium sp. WL30]|uniref:hypothetical protein n=1 Tax=unclassified Methylobacterium TaxID=2615210 RepID=UPI0011C7A282|nr:MULTISPECIES: hypothetical protein [unclassified Methylobacterium]TXN41270.1 hypothetical protein FV225_03090 [Methylobacterium sp. WL93]TXN50955.1 hypothetical protein FV227_09845 [Methylobacterium sp. WL119]TXN68172.1 hypothetical protein FV232_09770 [Methylobacterium sp. WL30]TXN69148.1 hypothetical protein FV228_12920 [Methylobacterium sp. WL18]